MDRRPFFITTFAGLILSVGLLVLAIFSLVKGPAQEVKGPVAGSPVEGEIRTEPLKENGSASDKQYGERFSPFPLVVVPPLTGYSAEESPLSPPDLVSQGGAFLQEKLRLPSLLPGGQSPPAQTKQAAPPSPSRLTEQEIFSIIWPQDYRKILRSFEVIVSRDWTHVAEVNLDSNPHAYAELPAREGLSASTTTEFLTDNDIYDSFLKIGDGAYRQGWINEADYRTYQKGIREILPLIMEQEKAELRRMGRQSNLLLKDQFFSAEKNARGLITDLIDGVKYTLFLANPADARWVTQPECYKDDNPDNEQKGNDAAAFCCNCGLKCGKACVFIQDCGQNGQNCNVQLGCLNQICGNWPNAIWDPQTFICGCG